MNNIKLQFTRQDYQKECVHNIVSIFDEVEKHGIKNLSEINTIGKILKDTKLAKNVNIKKNNIDVVMETGTGKTFTFLDSIFNINKEYKDIKKFVVLVPTIAIREGTKSNIEATKGFFKSNYTKEINSYYFDSKASTNIIKDFISDDELSVFVLNSASFNSVSKRLNKQPSKYLMEFGENQQPDTWLHAISSICDVVIMDEPHRFLGNSFKKYFNLFNSKPVIRFGATFPKTEDDKASNIAYNLDGIGAFSQNLVKRIIVNTIGSQTSNDKLTKILEKNKVVEISTTENGFSVIKELKVGQKYNSQEIKKINKNNIVLTDDTIVHLENESSYKLSEDDINIMLEKTVQLHFEKEYNLFKKGIKTLSLFFIKKVEDYRDYNNKDKDKNKNKGFIAYQLEKLYKQSAIDYIENEKINKKYKEYLQSSLQDISKIHGGYFSKDNSNSDENIKEQVADILKNKEKLLSLNNHRKFLFSQWALQEGWDNPNVFTICKLSSTGSEITKIQQIGRGLRIAVNQKGTRQTIDKFNSQDDFYSVNSLNMVVSSNEQGFIEQIQNEIKEHSLFILDSFRVNHLEEKLKGTDSLLEKSLQKVLIMLENSNAIIKNPNITSDTEYKLAEDFTEKLKDVLADERGFKYLKITKEDIKAFNKLVLDKDFDIARSSDDKGLKKQDLIIKKEKAKEFKLLWDKINKQAIYTTKKLEEQEEQELITIITNKINNTIEKREQFTDNITQILNSNNPVGKNAISTKEDEKTPSTKREEKINLKSFILDVVNKTNLPINFVITLLNKVNYSKIGLLDNPKYVQSEIIELIKSNMFETIISNISYEITGNLIPTSKKNSMYDDEGNFKTRLKAGSTGKTQHPINHETFNKFNLKNKWLFENVIESDSDFERDCINNDSDSDKITVFAKLPNLNIKTPVGEYNPDFAYFIESNNNKKLFLIIETKGYKGVSSIVDKDEYKKIQYAKKFFNSLKESMIDDNIKVVYKTRFEKETLSNIIKSSISEN